MSKRKSTKKPGEIAYEVLELLDGRLESIEGNIMLIQNALERVLKASKKKEPKLTPEEQAIWGSSLPNITCGPGVYGSTAVPDYSPNLDSDICTTDEGYIYPLNKNELRKTTASIKPFGLPESKHPWEGYY